MLQAGNATLAAGSEFPEQPRTKFNIDRSAAGKARRTVDGVEFDSELECRVYRWLVEALGRDNVQLQPKFVLLDKFRGPDGKVVRAIEYVADFLLGARRPDDPTAPIPPGALVVDAKGMLTDGFALKTKMFTHRYGAYIKIVRTRKDVEQLLRRLRGDKNPDSVFQL